MASADITIDDDRAREIAEVYTDNHLLLRFLSQFGWGDLVNIGYYAWPTLPALAGGLAFFQRSLVNRSIGLLDARPGDRVIDASCGRGWSTAELAARGYRAVGLDLSPEQIERARRRFGSRPRASFHVADVTALPARVDGTELRDGGFDRVHCLEAAFHYGSEGRRAFLEESHRMLRPGGRLVLVDFTLPAGTDPAEFAAADPRHLVRTAWSFDTFEPVDRYVRFATDAGFTVRRVLDWSRPSLRRGTALVQAAAALTDSTAGRAALCAARPRLRAFTPDDWAHLTEVLRAHQAFEKVHYAAFVLDKPAAG
ncbi:class I SAM-dependent methyltransferase [Streptomyces pactum]|uniref:class I SAM-dependent methyltransferase n=1 Tax=Streptomyces pactum TaxID=68249 RepID=UPI0036FFAD69